MRTNSLLGVLGLFMLSLAGCENIPPTRTFLVPSDYQGTLRIVYSERCGVQPRLENGKEIVDFQNNGLIILAVDNDRRVKNDFYLVDNQGKRTRVNQLAAFKDRLTKLPALIAGREEVTSMEVVVVNFKSTRVAGGADCMDYYLYNKDTTKIDTLESARRLNVLTNSLVNACRKKK